jgi:hypothetical protein
VTSYTWRASLDPDVHEVRGEGRITWENTSDVPQREMFVHLYLNAFQSERTRFMRSRASGGFRGSQSLARLGRIDVERFEIAGVDVWPEGATTPGDPEDQTDILVSLPSVVQPGERIEIDVAFVSVLPSVFMRTGFEGSFHMVAQWFPKVARLEPSGQWAHFPFERLSEFYADFGDYDVTIEVPASFVVGATGERVEERTVGDRKSVRYVQRGVIDFAFAAWDGFEELARTTDDGVRLRALYPVGYHRAAEEELEAVEHGLAYFGERFGPYPYSTLTVVHPPEAAREAGGMEYPTLITTGGPWWMPWSGVHGLELVTAHELAHQWFYGIVATDEHRYPLLDEGLTTYADMSALEQRFGPGSLVDALGWQVSLPAAYRLLSVDAAPRAPVAQPAPDFRSGSEYGALVYYRTATVLASLEGAFGSAVTDGIEAYARKHRFAHPDPHDLVREIEAAAGPEAARALSIALFDRGWVNYRVASIDERAAVIRRDGSLFMPVDIDLWREDGSRERRTWDGSDDELLVEVAEGAPLARVWIDPEHRVLVDADLLDNAASRDGGARVAVRVWERTAFAFASLLAAVGP